MYALVDTHTLLWFLGGDPKLSKAARAACEAPLGDVRVSVASLWEIAIKYSRGKLRLADGMDGLLRAAFADNDFVRLAVEPSHLSKVATLPFRPLPNGDEHRDPFDRLLVAQALADGATLVTKETWWRAAYGVTVAW